jgi:hypothetical protein
VALTQERVRWDRETAANYVNTVALGVMTQPLPRQSFIEGFAVDKSS